ncbi:hypothetical protein [Niallia sp. 03190]|uniref:hypothetical protein n=1 Tax=Niallia sp. 03190 TaxID=3458061 RepID=UPI0040451672
MKKHYLIGLVQNKETFKNGPGNFTTYIHVKVVKTTEPNVFGFTQIACELTLSWQAKQIKDNKHVYVEFSSFREDIHKGRPRITVKAKKLDKVYSKHFRIIDHLLEGNDEEANRLLLS